MRLLFLVLDQVLLIEAELNLTTKAGCLFL